MPLTQKVEGTHDRGRPHAELMTEAGYNEQRQLAENQAKMFKIQQHIAESKARAEVYGKRDTKSIDDRSQLSDDKIDLAQRYQSRNIAQSSLHHHRSNALQKGNDATYETLVIIEVT